MKNETEVQLLRLLETVQAVVDANENGEEEFLKLLLPTLKKELQDFEREYFPNGKRPVVCA